MNDVKALQIICNGFKYPLYNYRVQTNYHMLINFKVTLFQQNTQAYYRNNSSFKILTPSKSRQNIEVWKYNTQLTKYENIELTRSMNRTNQQHVAT